MNVQVEERDNRHLRTGQTEHHAGDGLLTLIADPSNVEFDAVRIHNIDLTRPQVIHEIAVYVAVHLNRLVYLHQNPAVANVDIVINGETTVLQRANAGRVIRCLDVLLHIHDHLCRGILPTRRGIYYYYCHCRGESKKDSFVPTLKHTLNSIRLPPQLLFSTESCTIGFASFKLQVVQTGRIIDLSDPNGAPLGDEVIRSGKFKLLGCGNDAIENVVVVEKASIARKLAQRNFAASTKSIVLCCKGYPVTSDRAWLHTFCRMFNLSEDRCFGLSDFNPHGWALLNSFSYVSNPIKCEDIFGMRLQILVSPAFIDAFPEAMASRKDAPGLKSADKAIVAFLMKKENKFLERNEDYRMSALDRMLEEGAKIDLDALDIDKLIRNVRFIMANPQYAM